MLFNELVEFVHEIASLRAANVSPRWVFERLAGSFYGVVHIFCACRIDGGDFTLIATEVSLIA